MNERRIKLGPLYLNHGKSPAFCLFVTAFLLFWIGLSSAGASNMPKHTVFSGVDFRDGLLRVSVEKQKLEKVLDAIAKKTGIEIIFNVPADEELSVSFDYLPLEQALKKLLTRRNYVFVYGSAEGGASITKRSSSLMKVLIFPEAGGRTAGRARLRVISNEKQDRIQEKLDEAVQSLSQSGIDLRERIKDAMEKGREIEDDVIPLLYRAEAENINKALSEIEGIGNVTLGYPK
jgi:hypothetical protein